MRRPRAPRRETLQKGIIILPSAFTLGNLFFGIYAIIAATRGDLVWAGWFIVFAGTLDGPTGLVATEAICASEAGDYYHIDPDLDVQAGDRVLEIPY